MRARIRSPFCIAVATIALVTAGGVAPEPVGAAIGDVFTPGGAINLKQANGTDLCAPVNISGIGNNITGTSVGIVRGAKLGPDFIQHRALLATSCLGVSTDATRKRTIHFVNPLTGVSVHFISTSIVPPRGWSAFAPRSDKGDFLACVATGASNGNLEIYKVSYQGTPQVTAVLLVGSTIVVNNGPLKGPVCDGLAWDYDSKTIYASTDGGTTIRRWASANNDDSFAQVSPDLTTPTQTPLGGGSPRSCLNSGLAFVDGALFVACQALSSGSLASTGHLVNKNTGTALSAFGTGSGPLFDQTITEDVECDPVTFAGQNRDALWAKNRTTNVLTAFELPGFTCGRSIGPLDGANTPLVTLKPPSFRGPGACPVSYPFPDLDTDGDGLLDCWEDGTLGQPGIDWDGDGNPDVVLCVNGQCADKLVKDLFVEVDSMAQHPFDATARQQVIDAFTNAPVEVRLHILADDGNAPGTESAIAHKAFIALEPCTPAAGAADANFDNIKKAFLGTAAERGQGPPQSGRTVFAKRMGFRYAVLAHDLKPPASNPGARSSGCAEIAGDDLVITLGSVFAGTPVPPGPPGVTLPAHINGSVHDQAGTFMHELGHTLGLLHGGRDPVNCKPNYLSVMSYPRQFSEGAPLTGRRLDYSRSKLPTVVTPLDEATLDEAAGIGVPSLPPGVTDETVFAADKAGGGRVVVIVPAGPNIDWNNDGVIAGSVASDANNFDFADSEISGCAASANEELEGHDDWANLQYNHRASLEAAASGEIVEPVDGLLEAFQNVDVNGDGLADGVCQVTGQLWVIDIQGPININKPSGIVPVDFFSQQGCPVENINPATVFLAGSGGKFGVRVNDNGSFACNAVNDKNGDGLREFRCQMHDDGLIFGDVLGVVEAVTFPDPNHPQGVGLRARGPVEIQ